MAPPKAKKATERVREGFARLAANPDKMEAMRENAETSKYFDGSSPSTRMKRDQVRTYYEQFVETCYGVTDVDEVWNHDTFVARAKQFLEGVVNVAIGKFEERIKTSTLWSYKHALNWWAAVLVKDFGAIWHQYHVEVSRHIHQLAVQEPLSILSWKKNNLSDSELVLIFQHIQDQRYNVANLKQHWGALLLAWLTAARPGSFTVTKGYEKGAALGLPDQFRTTDETLRWRDVDFVNMTGGIAVRVTFRYSKGYRNPNLEGSKEAGSARTFLFLPSMAERLEFDLPIVLFGIAYERGLFVQSLEEILHQESDNVFLEKSEEVNEQAVFIAATQSGKLDPQKPMTIQALNPKLQQLCTAIGLIERNTYYSLRRTAIIETRRHHNTEAAKDLAFHVGNANSLFYYDNVGFGDLDMQSYRFGGPGSMNRDDIRKYFSQSNISRWQPSGDEAVTLKQAIEQKTRDQLSDDHRYIDQEQALKALYDDVKGKLQSMQHTGQIPQDINIPTGYGSRDGAKYMAIASQYEVHESVRAMETMLAARKSLYRAIRLEIRKMAAEEVRQQHRAVLTGSQKQAQKTSTESPFQPEAVAKEPGFLDEEEGSIMMDEDESGGVDEDVLENAEMNSREEPECWQGLQPVVQIQLGNGDTSARTLQIRRDFLMKWIGHKDSVVPQSNLTCPLCQVDITMDDKAKNRKFTLFRLNTHLRGSTHSRETELRRALKNDGKDKTSLIACPVCKLLVKGTRMFVKHIKTDHTDQLWEDLEDESEEEGVLTSEFEGFSDAEDEQRNAMTGVE